MPIKGSLFKYEAPITLENLKTQRQRFESQFVASKVQDSSVGILRTEES